MDYVWKLLSAKKFQEKTDPEEIARVLLLNRKIVKPGEVKNFFEPDLDGFLSLKISGLEKGVNRVLKAKEREEKVVVFSDYDADGLCACAILWETLYELKMDVLPYVPDRIKEGYGLNCQALEKMAGEGVSLVITVDHGISAQKEIEFAKKLGVDIIVTDHHEKPKKLPLAFSIIHSTDLCGAGVALRFAYEIGKSFKIQDKIIENKLELAALATVGDLVPLKNYNRAIVKFGLEKLNKTKRSGILALISKTNLILGKISERDISHTLVPKINAAGRVGNAILSLRLLCTKDPNQAMKLSGELFETNSLRQGMLEEAIIEARSFCINGRSIGILVSQKWHEGIIGLIASRMVEEAGRPMIVISSGDKFSRGSARSVGNFNMIETLRSFSDLLVEVGGHPMAAGFTIETKKIIQLQKRLEKIDLKDFEKGRILEIDCELGIANIQGDLWQTLEKFSPFGVGNPQPQFLTKNALISDLKTVGQDQTHLRLTLEGLNAIAFGQAQKGEELRPFEKIDLVYTIEPNEYQKVKSLQLKVKDFRQSQDSK